MKSNHQAHIYLVMALMALLALPVIGIAQDDDDGNYFTVSTFQVSFSDLEDLFKMWEEDADLEIANEFFISQKYLTHRWGPDWSFMIISEYKEFGDIDKALARRTELYRAKYPKEKVRDARDKAFAKFGIRDGHTDAILRENTKLSK